MVSFGAEVCPECGGELRFFDKVRRIYWTKRKKVKQSTIRRFKCTKCKKIHREIPDYIIPYKRYESEIIFGVLEGFITPETLGFEDYPCETTMFRWKSQNKHFLL